MEQAIRNNVNDIDSYYYKEIIDMLVNLNFIEFLKDIQSVSI